MAFYVSNNTGSRMAGGKVFDTLEAAEIAAQKSVRIAAASKRAHGWSPFDVMEDIPGRHTIRSIVYPDKIERV